MTNIKQICAQLIELWDADCDINTEINELRTALAESESEGPTDADLHAMAFSYSQPCYEFEYIPFARSVLARWGK